MTEPKKTKIPSPWECAVCGKPIPGMSPTSGPPVPAIYPWCSTRCRQVTRDGLDAERAAQGLPPGEYS